MPTSALPRVGGREQKKKTGWEKERKKDEMQSKGVEGLRVCGFARAVGCRLLPSSPACSALSVVGTRETPVCCKHHPERGLRWPLRRVWGSVRPKRWDGGPRSGLAASAQATSTKFRRTFPVPHLVHLRANSFLKRAELWISNPRRARWRHWVPLVLPMPWTAREAGIRQAGVIGRVQHSIDQQNVQSTEYSVR